MISIVRPRMVSLKGAWHRMLYIHSRKMYVIQAHCRWSDYYWEYLYVWIDLIAVPNLKDAQASFSALVNCGNPKLK